MIYKIPDELVPYLEYIPEEMLSDVITDALKAAIFAPSVPVQQSQPVTSAFDMSQLLEQIKGLIGNDVQEPTPVVKTEEAKPSTVITTTVTDGVDADLQDIVGAFANSLFK